MIVAFLFDSDPPNQRNRNYYHYSRRLIFKSRIIQNSCRHLKMSIGDIVFGADRDTPTRQFIADSIYYSDQWGIILEDRLENVLCRAFVFAVVFENMTEIIAKEVHGSIKKNSTYLGCKSVNFSDSLQLASFRLVQRYRLKGDMCRSFYSMSSEDGKDEYDLAEMSKFGYTDIGWEDTGAHRTIFDDFDTVEHFKQVEAVKRLVSREMSEDADASAEFVMNLEDLNPALFNALGAAVFALETGLHADHFAQAALAGRRYLERLADTLFPARVEPLNGRDVSKKAFKNRLWAFLGEHIEVSNPALKTIGRNVDLLIDIFNRGIHGDITRDELLSAFSRTAALTGEMLSLDPEGVRKPYFAFAESMRRFFLESHRQNFAGDGRE